LIHTAGLMALSPSTCNVSLLYSFSSPFWKGVLRVYKAAQVWIRWKIGDGRSVRFWEDRWFGNCSLATQFWDLYIIADQKNVSIAEIWNGVELQISFRRGVTQRGMEDWLTLVAIAESVNFTEDCDSIFWAFDSSSRFSVQSMYRTISYRGIRPVFTPILRDLNAPPRIHIFLWLLSDNKTLTRTNLAKRKYLDDQSCLFCSENETVHHLFFDC
jgi:hypothetical protein